MQVLEDENVVEVIEGGQVTRFSLEEDPAGPDLLGWMAETGGEGPALEYPVTVSQVLEAAIRDWEAELVVFEHSAAVAEAVRARGAGGGRRRGGWQIRWRRRKRCGWCRYGRSRSGSCSWPADGRSLMGSWR